MAKLVIADEEGTTRSINLDGSEVRLGRHAECAVHLDERNVSRKHARIFLQGEAYWIEDLGSYTGTRINGSAVTEPQPLRDGDIVEIGDFQCKCRDFPVDAGATVPEAVAAVPSEAPRPIASVPPKKVSVPPGRRSAPPPRNRQATVRQMPKREAVRENFARLIMLSAPAPGTEFLLKPGKTRVGRAEDLDMWVNHRSISREHADIEVGAEGTVRVVDRGSANGTRIEGEEVWDETLTPGTVLQFGQVSFRFVAAGEQYSFEADHTVDLLALRSKSKRKIWPWVALVALCGLGVTGALVMRSQPSAVPQASAALGEKAPEVPPPAQGEALAIAGTLEACEEALEKAVLAEAEAVLAKARALAPTDPGTDACERGVATLREDLTHFETGQGALESGDFEAAYTAFARIDDSSALLLREEVLDAAGQYAAAHLGAAEKQLRREPEQALDEAELVLAMGSLAAAANLEQAQSLKTQAESRLAAAAAPRARAEAASATQRPKEAPSTEARPTRNNPRERATAKVAQGGKKPRPQKCSPLSPNYSECVVQSLEGRAKSPNQLALLIESYRQLGRKGRARRHMQDFVRRYPTHRLAAHYRQVLMRYGG